MRKGEWVLPYVLNDTEVKGISPLLQVPGKVSGKPHRLVANANLSFIGSYVLGMGFVMSPEEAAALIEKNPRNKDVLYPYLNGEDLNSRPDQSPSRCVINFHDWPLRRAEVHEWRNADEQGRKELQRQGIAPPDYEGPVAADYPDCLKIVEEKVKPERTRKKEDGNFALRYPRYLKWWIYGEKSPALYSTISGMERVLVTARVSNANAFSFVGSGCVYSEQLVVIASSSHGVLATIQNSIQAAWTNAYASTLGVGLRYTPSDCFENFPFPEILTGVEVCGSRYHAHRQSIMLFHHEGLTKTYNRFHDPQEDAEDIVKLRKLHEEMDYAVAAAYGWDDLELGHGFHETKQGIRYTICEPARVEVLDRLLALNHERHEEEVKKGLHDSGKKGNKKTASGKKSVIQQESLEF